HLREIFTGYERFWPTYRRLVSHAAAVVCVSEAVRAQFAETSTAEVIHDGLAVTAEPVGRAHAREQLGLAPDTIVCAVLGRISSWKGQDVLARALAEPELARIGAIGLVAG